MTTLFGQRGNYRRITDPCLPVIKADKVIDLAKGGPHADVDNGVPAPMELTDKDASILEQGETMSIDASIPEEGETMSVVEEESYSPMENPLKDVSPDVEEQNYHKPAVETVTEQELEAASEPIQNKYKTEAFITPNPTVKGLSSEQLIGRSFLLPQNRDGTRQRARIRRFVTQKNKDLKDKPEHIRFVCVRDNKKEEIVAYNNIANFIKIDDTWDGKWKYKAILKHQGPHKKGNANYKGSMYNLLIEWEDQTITWEPLSIFVEDNAALVTDYANKHNLRKKDGWRRHQALKRYYRNGKALI